MSHPFNSIVDAKTKRHMRNFFEVNWWRNRCVYHVWRWGLKDEQAFSCFSLHASELTVRVKEEAVISGRAVNARLRQNGINQLSHKTKWTADAGAAYFQLPQRPPAHQGVWLIPYTKDAHKSKILLLLLEVHLHNGSYWNTVPLQPERFSWVLSRISILKGDLVLIMLVDFV